MSDVHPRYVLMRANLHQSLTGDEQLKALARWDSDDDDHKALEEQKRVVEAAHASETTGADWGCGNAHWWPSQTEAQQGAFVYDEDQLLIAVTLVAANFQVSRIFDAPLVENDLFKVSTAANTQATGRRRGRQLGLISFLASAT